MNDNEFSVDGYIADVVADYSRGFPSVDEYVADVMAEFSRGIHCYVTDSDVVGDTMNGNEADEENVERVRKERARNAYPYEFGNVFEASWYLKFLAPNVRERTYYLSSRNRYGEFRSLFRMPLVKIDELVSIYIENGWVRMTKHCKSEEEMMVKLELRLLAVLKVLGHNAPFRTLQSDTNISDKEHRVFFKQFITHMNDIRQDYIGYPLTEDDLKSVMDRYAVQYLPGCGGSLDVVHVKWGNCPAEDVNRAKGKEGYPSLAFEVVTGFDRQILGVSCAHFGTRNDKQIVRTDETVRLIREDWYRNVEWTSWNINGEEEVNFWRVLHL